MALWPPPGWSVEPPATGGCRVSPRVRVGMDLVKVGEVASNLERFGDRYRARVFTAREVAESSGCVAGVEERSLAARFAAKEATFKVLRTGAEQPAWTDVEVRRDRDGGCSIALHGLARKMARDIGVVDLAVSLSHEDDVAAAFVVALCRSTRRCHRPWL